MLSVAKEMTQLYTEQCADYGIAFSFGITKKLHEEQSLFQHIEIYETQTFGNLMVIDGCMMLTTRDNFLYHEMMSHFPLFTHPNPQRVVIIGGGDCGTLREVLKHRSVEQAWQIDIDERVTRLAEQYFPELCASNDDPRAKLLFDDGIQWIKDAADNSLDIIIVDSTDPVGPAEGLFTEPFYKECHRALRKGGILIQQSESPLLHRDNIIVPMHQAMRRAGFSATKTGCFPQPCYPSGWWSCTMAGKDIDLNQPRLESIKQRDFKTVYYNEATHGAALAEPQFMAEVLAVMDY